AGALHEPSGARLQPRAAHRAALGQRQQRRGPHDRCLHPPAADGPRAARHGSVHPDGAQRRLPAFQQGAMRAQRQPATRAWWLAAGRLLGTIAAGLIVGASFGRVWTGLACALAVHLTWQLVVLFRVEWWVRHRSFAVPPEIGGVWGEIIAQIVRLHRRKRFHKQRFVRLMRQLQSSTAALPNGVVILNPQREIVWFNRMAGRLLDLRRAGDLGLRIENLLREPEFTRYLRLQDYTNPVVIRRANRDDCYLSLQIVPYGDGQQLLLAEDVSRQMRLEAVRRDFVANASHELRSPLTVICG